MSTTVTLPGVRLIPPGAMVPRTMSRPVRYHPSHPALYDAVAARAAAGGVATGLHDGVFAELVDELGGALPGAVDEQACALLMGSTARELRTALAPLRVDDPAFTGHALQVAAAAADALVTPTDLLAAAGALPGGQGGRLAALARLLGTWAARKEERGLRDGADVLHAAIAAARALPRTGLHRHVLGLVDLPPARITLLRALARSSNVTLHLPDVLDRPLLAAWLEPALRALEADGDAALTVEFDPLAPPGSALGPLLGALFTRQQARGAPVEAVVSPDARAEAEAAADWCAHLVQCGTPAREVAVVVRRRDGPWDEVLAEAFGARGLPLGRGGRPLAHTAFARAVERLFRAADGLVDVTDLEPLARLGGLEGSAARALSDELAPLLRSQPAAARAELLRGPRLPPALATAIASLAPEAGAEAYRAAVLGLLEGLRWPSGPSDGATRAALVAGLARVVQAAERAGGAPMLRGAFLGAVRPTLVADGNDAEDAVALLGATDVPGRRFRAVTLLGVAEGLFPEPAPRNPLLSEDDRAALNARLGRPVFRTDDENPDPARRSPPRDRLEPLLFALCLAAATERARVSHVQLAAGGRLQSPGPLFDEIQRVLGGDPPVAARDARGPRALRRAAGRAARTGARQAEGSLGVRAHALRARETGTSPWSGLLGVEGAAEAAQVVGGTVDKPSSASALQEVGSCPFRFMAEHLWGLEAREPAEDAPPPALLGELAHAVLEDHFGGKLGQRLEAPTPAERERVRAAVLRRGATLPGQPAIVHAALQALADQLVRSLDALATAPPAGEARVVAVEQAFGRAGVPPLRVDLPGGTVLHLKGAIDRVDELPDGTRVACDYKLSSIGGAREKLSPSQLGHDYVQLPLYLLALRAAGAPRAAGYLWSIRHARPTPLIGEPGPRSLEGIRAGAGGLRHDGMDARLVHLVGVLRGGAFTVTPSGPQACRFCPHRAVCRVGETRQAPDWMLETEVVP